tara:strand:- start:3723 stop:3884 length:162 start_codon:yes stop_codon:yes gene_type:complete
MTNYDLQTLFIVLQTFWDLFLILGFALLTSVAIAYISTYVLSEEEMEKFLNKK